MAVTGNDRSRTEVRFFGEITAALSHELKNVLAIINENAGLLEDLVYMSTGGTPLDPERLGTVAGKIRRQVRRADEMIKRLNQVGHSVDRPLDTVNLTELVETVCALAERKATLNAVALSITPSPEAVKINTDPYALQQLVWTCLGMMIPLAKTSGSIDIEIKSILDGGAIIFGPTEATKNSSLDLGPEWPPNELLGKLNANLVTDRAKGKIAIQLPLEIAV